MKRASTLILCAAVTGGLAAQAQITPQKTHLKVGDMAPEFTLPSTTGKPVTLTEYRGKKVVVLAFFSAAFTGG